MTDLSLIEKHEKTTTRKIPRASLLHPTLRPGGLFCSSSSSSSCCCCCCCCCCLRLSLSCVFVVAVVIQYRRSFLLQWGMTAKWRKMAVMMELGRAVSQVCWAWVLSRRIRQKTAPTPSSSNAGAGAGTPAAAGKGPQKSSQPPALSTAQTALQGVQQLSPSALWKGMCKVRLKKAGQASTDLEQFQATLG